MKAVIQKKYGDIQTLSLLDIDKPTFKNNEMLIKVKAANVSSGDMRVNTLSMPIFLKPIARLALGWNGPRHQIRGISGAGIIEAVGENITQYKVGDKIYFINSLKAGCLAEYLSLNEKSIIAKIPENMDYINAAPLAFGALTAIHFINSKTIKEGDQVLIYGASGSVGTYALQLAKYFGAIVTAVSSQKNHEKLKKLGADFLIDYNAVDFRTLEEKYDLIFDSVIKISKTSCKNVLKENGKFVSTYQPTKEVKKRLLEINSVIEKNQLVTLIDTVYDLQQFKKAHELTYSGRKVGNVIIQMP